MAKNYKPARERARALALNRRIEGQNFGALNCVIRAGARTGAGARL